MRPLVRMSLGLLCFAVVALFVALRALADAEDLAALFWACCAGCALVASSRLVAAREGA